MTPCLITPIKNQNNLQTRAEGKSFNQYLSKIKTIIKEKIHGVRLHFDYEVYNQNNQLLNTGRVTLICVDKQTNKPCKLPIWFEAALASFFE